MSGIGDGSLSHRYSRENKTSTAGIVLTWTPESARSERELRQHGGRQWRGGRKEQDGGPGTSI